MLVFNLGKRYTYIFSISFSLILISALLIVAWTHRLSRVNESQFNNDNQFQNFLFSQTTHRVVNDEPNPAMADYCGNWQEDYVQLHNRIRNTYNSSNPLQRFLIYQCLHEKQKCKGLGDELLGITTSLLIAILTNRAIIIRHDNFTSAFDPVTVDWRFTSDMVFTPTNFIQYKHLSLLRQRHFKAREAMYVNLLDVVFKGDKNSEVLFDDLLTVTENAKYFVLKINRGLTVAPVLSQKWWGVRLREMGLNADNVFGCLLRFLLSPKSELKKKVAAIASPLQSPSTFSVCIHHRNINNGVTDDKSFEVDKISGLTMKKYQFLFICASKLSSYFATRNQTVKWFFMSGSYLFKLKVQEKFNNTVLTADIKPKHVDYVMEGEDYVSILQSTVMEWYLYTLCDKFVFLSSGLSKTAAMYSLKPNSSYMFPHEAFRYRRHFGGLVGEYCKPDSPTPTTDMALEWSLL